MSLRSFEDIHVKSGIYEFHAEFSIDGVAQACVDEFVVGGCPCLFEV